MNSMFSGCKSLISLPDLSKWNTENIEEMNSVFSGCNKISKKPIINLKKWSLFD